MRAPQPVGTAIDAHRILEWTTEFAGYRIGVTGARIDRWLEQFDGGDRDLAARILDSVHYVGYEQVAAALREVLASLEGWSIDPDKRSGRWMFVPFTGSAGESGDLMLERLRQANNLKGRKYDELFCYRADLVARRPGEGDTVVLVDDFSGTGKQACRAWREVFRELLPLRPRVVLMLVAASREAQQKIEDETEMLPHAHIELGPADNILSQKCSHFTADDREVIRKYGKIADPKNPEGSGNCGFVLVFSHTCPNNTIPILHARRRKIWEGLFRRYD